MTVNRLYRFLCAPPGWVANALRLGLLALVAFIWLRAVLTLILHSDGN